MEGLSYQRSLHYTVVRSCCYFQTSSLPAYG